MEMDVISCVRVLLWQLFLLVVQNKINYWNVNAKAYDLC